LGREEDAMDRFQIPTGKGEDGRGKMTDFNRKGGETD
jgi:hypothetical protein